jgi:ABC-type spermidine/putrescine transport system permease subunit II
VNRSFLIVIVPAIAVGIGYIVVLRWLGYDLQPFRFIIAGIVTIAAIVLVQRYQRRKGLRKRP